MAERALRAAGRLALPLAVAIVVAVPLAGLALRAFADAWRAPALLPQELGLRGIEAVASEGIEEALANSLGVALAATLVALGLGWPAARAIARAGRLRPALLVAVALPLLVPPYTVGTGLAEWMLRLGLADTHAGLVLAHLVYVLPYALLVLTTAFTRHVLELEEAARTLGAGPARRLVHVTVPAVAPTLAVAAMLCFTVSWSQYATSLAVGGGLPTVPIVLVPFAQSDPQVAAALSLVFLAPPLLALAAAARAGRVARVMAHAAPHARLRA
ncbi:MAG TPA: ABC transporter permease subunit [Solirubrobacteraceae bacterium]|jgi:putative spermidine/putrescine transport system permease protein|nr:ABC transporter permease subunit [Solirubrobacteraceae bacterium]